MLQPATASYCHAHVHLRTPCAPLTLPASPDPVASCISRCTSATGPPTKRPPLRNAAMTCLPEGEARSAAAAAPGGSAGTTCRHGGARQAHAVVLLAKNRQWGGMCVCAVPGCASLELE